MCASFTNAKQAKASKQSYFDDPGIRGDLVRTDLEWEKWDFVKLSVCGQEEIMSIRNQMREIRVNGETRSGIDHANSTSAWARFQPKECVYFGDVSHKPLNCQKITKIEERSATLEQKNLCFNCATPNHCAAECFSKATCQHCKKRHHTSISDRNLYWGRKFVRFREANRSAQEEAL